MSSLKALIAKHAVMEREIRALSARIQKALPAELAAIPAYYGFSSIKTFKAAMLAAQTSKKIHKLKATKSKPITHDMKAELVNMHILKKTGAEIGWKLGISLKEVHRIKGELGLLKPRAPAPDLIVSSN